MKVVDLHPEELLDKDARGELNDAERERLDAHLARCATCRVERQLRADFAEELGDDADLELSAAELAALASGQPLPARRSATPEPPVPPVPPVTERNDMTGTEDVAPAPRRSTRPRRSARVWMIAAAALLVGGAAGANAAVRSWGSFGTDEAPAVPGRTPREAVPPPPMPLAPRSSQDPAPARDTPVDTAPVPAETALAPTPVAPAPMHVVTVAHAAPVAPPPAIDAVPAPAAPETTASTLFDDATQARRNGDYSRAILLGRQLQARFPASREAHVSYATVGQLLLDRGDALGALASFDAYQARGRGELDEAVMVGRATALERLGRADEARAAWSALLAAFPSSPYTKHVRVRAGASTGD